MKHLIGILDFLNLLDSFDLHRLANATNANSDVPLMHYHFLIPDDASVSNVQESKQLATLFKRKALAKIVIVKLKTLLC